jgi:hypothetical protein
MRVIFYLKGSAHIEWRVPEPSDNFNFQYMVKVIRADGQFLTDGIYIHASEIAAIELDNEDGEDERNVGVFFKGKTQRLIS